MKGAFSGAVADRPRQFRAAQGGTLFLDEIGDMPLPVQAKILRALQERQVTPVGGTHAHPVKVRIIAATHHDLPLAVGGALPRRPVVSITGHHYRPAPAAGKVGRRDSAGGAFFMPVGEPSAKASFPAGLLPGAAGAYLAGERA